MYAGIATAILIGRGVIFIFLAKIVSCFFLDRNSKAKSHLPSCQEIPRPKAQSIVPVPQPPTTEQIPKIHRTSSVYAEVVILKITPRKLNLGGRQRVGFR